MNKLSKCLVLSAIVLFTASAADADSRSHHETPWLRLSDTWYFHPGDDSLWAQPQTTVNGWNTISTRRNWEYQGFADLDGFAWYRQQVTIPKQWRREAERRGGLYLMYGSADDADEAFFNGVSLGRNGDFPPHYQMTPGQPRKWFVPARLIRYGKPNTIALRVYDGAGYGGVVSDSVVLAVADPVADVNVRLSSPGEHWVFDKGEQAAITVTTQLDKQETVSGQLVCRIVNDFHEPVDSVTLPLTIPAGQPQSTRLPLSITRPGFYHLTVYMQSGGVKSNPATFWVGRDPEDIISPTDAQPDFDAFWKRTRAELDRTPMNAKMVRDSKLSDDKKTVYRVSLTSLDGKEILATYAVPTTPGPHPALLTDLGYAQGEDFATVHTDNMPGYCELVLSVRGQGLQIKDNPYGEWITYGVHDKDTYYYRGAYMDLVRAVDFLVSRPEVDSLHIFAGGLSQGGALTLAVAALDHRICAIAPCVPFLSDFPDYFRIVDWPRDRFDIAIEKDPTLHWPDIYRVLSYFDIKNLAPNIQCPVMMGVGLQDGICPPHTNFSGYNLIKSPKHRIIYPYQGHGVDDSWYAERRAFFDKIIQNDQK